MGHFSWLTKFLFFWFFKHTLFQTSFFKTIFNIIFVFLRYISIARKVLKLVKNLSNDASAIRKVFKASSRSSFHSKAKPNVNYVQAAWPAQPMFKPVNNRVQACQQPCSCMIEHVVREWWNNKIERQCYNNHELGCCIKSGFACSNIHEQPLSIRQVVYTICRNTIEQCCYFNRILFYHVNSVVTGLLSQQPCNSLWFVYACTWNKLGSYRILSQKVE